MTEASFPSSLVLPFPLTATYRIPLRERTPKVRQRATTTTTTTTPSAASSTPVTVDSCRNSTIEVQLRFNAGDDAFAQLSLFCQREDLPDSVHRSLRALVHALFLEEIHMMHSAVTAVPNLRAWREAHAPFTARTSEADSVLMVVDDSPLESLPAGMSLSTGLEEHGVDGSALGGASGAGGDSALEGVAALAARAYHATMRQTPMSRAWQDLFKSSTVVEAAPDVWYEAGRGEQDAAGGGRGGAAAGAAATSTTASGALTGGEVVSVADAGKGLSLKQAREMEESAFVEGYGALQRAGGDFVRNLFHLERMDALALGRAFEEMEAALSKLQQQHSSEMDEVLREIEQDPSAAELDEEEQPAEEQQPAEEPKEDDMEGPRTVFEQQSNTDRISRLVNRQVADTKLLENRWTKELNKLKRKQHANYRKFVQSLFLRDLQGQSDGGTSGATPKFGSIEDAAAVPALITYHDPSSELLAREVWVGSGQQKALFTVRLLRGDVTDLCLREFSESEFEQSRVCARYLYSESLSAFVLPHKSNSLADMGGLGASPRVKRFVKACDRSTEYHFKSLSAQMRSIKILAAQGRQQIQQQGDGAAHDEYRSLSNPTTVGGGALLHPGDFFITRHSNLLSVHLGIHIIDSQHHHGSDGGAVAGQDPVLKGLREAIQVANRQGVHFLAIPILFSETPRVSAAQSLPKDTAKRMEAVVRCVRASLADLSPDSDSSLRQVALMVPVPKKPAHKRTASHLQEKDLLKHAKLAFANVFGSS